MNEATKIQEKIYPVEGMDEAGSFGDGNGRRMGGNGGVIEEFYEDDRMCNIL